MADKREDALGPPEYYSPAERAQQKQAMRDQDEQDLKAGKVTRQELQRRNSLFPEGWARNARIIASPEFD